MPIRKNRPAGFVDAALESLGSIRTSTLLSRLDAATPDETTFNGFHNRLREARLDGIVSKRNRGQQTLYPWQERWNAIVSRARARAEHPFAMLKHQLGYRTVRYRGLERNGFDVCLMLMACNFKRGLWLGTRSAGIGVEPVPKE